MKTLIIGLGYRARQGKDFLAARIMALYSPQLSIMRFSFAKHLKREISRLAAVIGMEALCDLCGVPFETGLDPKDDMEMFPFTKQRGLLQWYGTEFWRRRDRDHWVRLVQKEIDEIQPQVAIITDMRFRNEANWVGMMEGECVRVSALDENGKVEKSPCDLTLGYPHPSEHDLDDFTFDYGVEARRGDLDGLYAAGGRVFMEIFRERGLL